MTKPSNFYHAIVKSPILWGGLASVGFYALVRADVIRGELLDRYFASHPVEYAATAMFFVGLAALLIKLLDTSAQRPGLSEPLLGAMPQGGQRVEDCHALLERLERLPRARRRDCLVCRLREAIRHVQRRRSADALDDELKYLADLDAGRLHASYALVRVIIWAIPILGFLGTVIGITMAIANLADGAIENSIPQVVGGLSVAFATTTQALLLSIVLMFAQYYTHQKENALLADVDQRAAAELEGRFERLPEGPDGQLAAVRGMADTVVCAAEQLVRRQAELWRSSMEVAGRRWAQMADTAGKQLQTSLEEALAKTLEQHARQLAAAEQQAAAESRRHGDRLQQTQLETARAMASLESSLVAQAEVLKTAVEAAGEVTRLEDALNRNLAALAGAKNFEQTVMSLAAAIHLLNAQLADRPAQRPPVQLDSPPRKTQAA